MTYGRECRHCGKHSFADVRPSTILRHERVCLSNLDRRLTKSRCKSVFVHVFRVRVCGVPRSCRWMPYPTPRPKNYDAGEFPLLRGMPTQQHTAILVDPPFSYERSVGQGVAANHYATMTDAQLAALPVGSLAARDAMLFFWCSGPTISRALWLCSQWGFKYKTMAFVWVKTNRKDAPQSMGLGSYTLPGTEFVLLATKGHAAPLIIKRLDQVVMHRRGGHSEKPAIFRELIDEMTGHDQQLRKIELFSRTPADGSWSAWGDQITKP